MPFLYVFGGLFAFLLLLLITWLICLLSYRKNEEIAPYRGTYIAHRGLHDGDKPENSLAAFQAAKDAGFAMEFDLHLTADGRLVVHHDDHTARMCGEKRVICESTFDDLRALRLPDGSQIPSFEELLALVDGAVPLLIELKTDKNNAPELCAKTLEALKGYNGKLLIESFDPRVLVCLKKTAPDILRGQLSDNFMKAKGLSFFTRLLLTLMLYNVAARPDFIAFNVEHRSALTLRLLEKAGAPVFFWTVRDKETARENAAAGQASIFERFLP